MDLGGGKRHRETAKSEAVKQKRIKVLEDVLARRDSLEGVYGRNIPIVLEHFLLMDVRTILNLRGASKKIDEAMDNYLDAKFWRAIVLGDFFANVSDNSFRENIDDPDTKGLIYFQRLWDAYISKDFYMRNSKLDDRELKKYWINLLNDLQRIVEFPEGQNYLYPFAASMRALFHKAKKRTEDLIVSVSGIRPSTQTMIYDYTGPFTRFTVEKPIELDFFYYKGSSYSPSDIERSFDVRIKIRTFPRLPENFVDDLTEETVENLLGEPGDVMGDIQGQEENSADDGSVITDTGSLSGDISFPPSESAKKWIGVGEEGKPETMLQVEYKPYTSDFGETLYALRVKNFAQVYLPMANLNRYVMNYKNRLRFYNITQEQVMSIAYGGDFPPHVVTTVAKFKLEKERLVVMEENGGTRLWEHDRDVPVCGHFHIHEDLVKWLESRVESEHPCPTCHELC